MRKNFNKIPIRITRKLEIIQNTSTEAIVGVLLVSTKSELQAGKYAFLGITVTEGVVTIPEPFIPPQNRGKYSKRNVSELVVVRRELGMTASVSYDMPIYGNWSNGSFTMTRSCYPRETLPPINDRFVIRRVEQLEPNDDTVAIFVEVRNPISFASTNRDAETLHKINLLYESAKQFDVYPVNPSVQDLRHTAQVNWTIFPVGDDVKADVHMILGRRRNLTPEQREIVEDRMRTLYQYNPQRWIAGNEGLDGYIGVLIDTPSGTIAVFENDRIGNALYIIKDEWENLSKLSRTILRGEHANQIVRIPHLAHWKTTLDTELQRMIQ